MDRNLQTILLGDNPWLLEPASLAGWLRRSRQEVNPAISHRTRLGETEIKWSSLPTPAIFKNNCGSWTAIS